MHLYDITGDLIVGSERKSLRDTAMVSQYARMDPCGRPQRFDTREERIAKIAAETLSLLLIEMKAGN